MATWQQELVDPPTDLRSRELWLQHASGLILFEDVRRFATERIDPDHPAEVRAEIQKGIDDAVNGLMMGIDGVSGTLSNAEYAVDLNFIARCTQRDDSGHGKKLVEIDLQQGDGMCMGYQGWINGDFGEDPVAILKGQ
jgi:hypothetical protein